ncbi:tol-pal system protein YbgF [Salinicola rhizosphaerae]|uniref:Cell division coordinator CpoB n=1 Tax=Salinicola rhizosphaerae TaxID=1443141 RepID=A0ABQ3DRL0_9GAMM|nr:tol-pal system protein YbgF [Salinicola rhizosphaerae]GHB09369.1 tol-pal system protein YbgF [Salinicola rhizosphaerae]
MKHGLKRLCGAGALVLPLSVWAQQPVVDDLTGQSSGFYNQTEARESSGGTLTILNQLQDNRQQIQQLRGQVEELRYQLEQLKQQTQNQYLDLDDRISGGGSTSDTGADSAMTGGSAATDSGSTVDSAAASDVTNGGQAAAAAAPSSETGTSAPAASGGSGEGRDAYQAAFQKVQSRQFDAAISAFQQFISDYPQSSLVSNAHYWLGELYSAQSQLDSAADAFDTVINDYPQSNKVPDALYKLGLLKARQGDTSGSRELLQRVRSDYPDSNAAQMAGDFLNQTGG